jgi:CheY-like chemotaxis protein
LEKNKKILVIDDEAPIRRVLELKLQNQGYQVLTANNGQEGLHIVESQHPDVVVTDIMMPQMDGKTLCSKTNHLKKERRFLTIVVTARINPGDQDWIDSMEDTLFMEKPFSPARIVKAIEQYLGGQG